MATCICPTTTDCATCAIHIQAPEMHSATVYTSRHHDKASPPTRHLAGALLPPLLHASLRLCFSVRSAASRMQHRHTLSTTLTCIACATLPARAPSSRVLPIVTHHHCVSRPSTRPASAPRYTGGSHHGLGQAEITQEQHGWAWGHQTQIPVHYCH
ncbi:hypothetical protein BDN70DRAFT_972762 [Pholiota conissans]|uniref:Uncharacterized protein n=1 Tax=Pholiota conissans TaxID=109636 RepID=A0A9P6CMA2_9AGAR|nr:hypothetical protein BDN70DRAFT_972762 [Pholiota conissans]